MKQNPQLLDPASFQDSTSRDPSLVFSWNGHVVEFSLGPQLKWVGDMVPGTEPQKSLDVHDIKTF